MKTITTFFPLLCLLISSCAGVSFKQLTPALDERSNSPNGAVYYLPKPYLLVAQLPVKSAGVAAVALQASDPFPPPKRNDGAGMAKKGKRHQRGLDAAIGGAEEPKADKDESASTVASGSDQSFAATSGGYSIKLIYLPDLSRPMSVSVRAGLGAATLKPTLQNGWMLTGFDANADSKASELLASIASVVTAFKTPGKAAAGGGDDKSGGGDAASSVLKPGLYSFKYGPDGALLGLCPVSFFGHDGTTAPTPTDVRKGC